MKTGDRVVNDLLRPVPNVRFAMVRMTRMPTNRGVRVILVLWLRDDSYRSLLVKERGWVDRNLGRVAFAIELAKGPAGAFSPLKAVLASISGVYAQYQVRFGAPFNVPSDDHISRIPSPSRTRSKYFVRASRRWSSFSSNPQAMGRKQNVVKNY